MASKKQNSRKAARRRRHQKKTRRPTKDLIPEVITQLRALQTPSGRVLEARHSKLSWLRHPAIHVRLDTAEIGEIGDSERGLVVQDSEDVYLVFVEDYPNRPPMVFVDDDARFVGFPHVICARELCVYLDPHREWHPTFGASQIIDRILRWFEEAASGQFDPRTSFFHAVGGANPATEFGTTSVILASPPSDMSMICPVALVERSASRIDLVDWRRAIRANGETNGLAIRSPSSLPYGLGDNVQTIASRIEEAGGASGSDVVRNIRRAATTSPAGRPIYLCLVVAHPTEVDLPTVVVGRIDSASADQIRSRSGTVAPFQTKIGWMPISDERPTVTTPRDNLRPTAVFRDASVEVWGCGGLGSWIAEFVTRARPAKLVLRDPAQVHRGHLVRQNYAELDVGEFKVSQLAARLSAISDTTDVSVGSLSALDVLQQGSIPECDLVIDATVNEAVAFRLDQVAADASDRPLLAQVATNAGSGTLGLVVVAGSEVVGGPNTVDQALAEQVLADGTLEPYRVFWSPPSRGEELNPSPGCSVPTYHGSAADLAATSGSMVSLLGQQLTAPASGVHLFAAAHSGIQPSYRFEPYTVTDRTIDPTTSG